MMTTNILFYLLLRSQRLRLNTGGSALLSSSVATRNFCHCLSFPRYATPTRTRSSVVPFSRTLTSSADHFPSPATRTITKPVSSSLSTHYYYRFHHGSFPLRRRAAFSSTTALSAAQSSDDSSSSSSVTNLSPLALSIEQALEELIVKKEDVVVGHEESSVPSRLDTKQQQEQQETKQRFLLVLSVSGGCDSVALLHATMELQKNKTDATSDGRSNNSNNNWELDCHVVHFHHRQRDKEADLDCQLVQELAQEEYGIPFVLQDWNDEQDTGRDLANIDAANNTTTTTLKFTQDRARQWRRRRLLEYTKSVILDSEKTSDSPSNYARPIIGVILTAHHRDDSEESLLLKLLRGVHILNLSGMEAITTPIILEHGKGNENGRGDKIYILRPWLKQRKADLQDYLLSNNKSWREDASNSSPKYLRNRVRNELIPLLEDLSPTIHKRLEILKQQSFELQQDLEPRILAHLKQHTVIEEEEEETSTADAKPKLERRQYIWNTHGDLLDEEASPLVQSQALFRWMQDEMGRFHELSKDGSNRHASAVSYETLQRVLKQLRNYPNQLDWSMHLGGNSSLQRKGNRLKIVHSSPSEQEDDSKTQNQEWKWSIMTSKNHPSNESRNDDEDSSSTFLTLALPAEMITSHLQFVETTVGDYGQLVLATPKASKRFCPPWKSRPMKLGQFLRGQKVPLHQRDATPVLYMTTAAVQDEPPENNDLHDKSTTMSIVAIQVNGTWLVHADYNSHQEENVNVNESTTTTKRLTVNVERP